MLLTMRNRLSANALLLVIAFVAGAVYAAVDDMENNADLQPTLEEHAREFILKRWPEAKDIQVFALEEADEDFDADDFEHKSSRKRRKRPSSRRISTPGRGRSAKMPTTGRSASSSASASSIAKC
jgi:hypothetical protein